MNHKILIHKFKNNQKVVVVDGVESSGALINIWFMNFLNKYSNFCGEIGREVLNCLQESMQKRALKHQKRRNMCIGS